MYIKFLQFCQYFLQIVYSFFQIKMVVNPPFRRLVKLAHTEASYYSQAKATKIICIHNIKIYQLQ